MAPRAGLAEAGDGAINQRWIDRAQIVITQAVFFELIDFVIFQHDVALRRQLAHDGLAFRRGNIQSQRFLAAIAA